MFTFICTEDKALLQQSWGAKEYVECHGVHTFPVSYWEVQRASFYQLIHDFSMHAFPNEKKISLPVSLTFFQGQLSIVAWARLDNRMELFIELGFNGRREHNDLSDVELICHCYRKWGQDCVDYLVGDFAFVLYDKLTGCVFGARDHFGVRPLYYSQSHRGIYCSTSMGPLLDFFQRTGTTYEPDQKWVCDYLCEHGMDFSATAVQQIKKLAPGHSFTWVSGKLEIHRYYTLSVQAPHSATNQQECIEIFRERLQEVVSQRLGGQRGVGLELSGGLDSGGISGIVANEMGDKISSVHCYGFAQFENDYDYMAKQCRAIQDRCSVSPILHQYDWKTLNQKSYQTALLAEQFLGHPLEHESSSFIIPLLEDARRHNVGCLLSGFGGDEFVTNIQHNLVLKYLISKKMFIDLPGCFGGNSFVKLKRSVGALTRYYMQSVMNSRSGFNATLYDSFSKYWSYFLVVDELKAKYKIKQRYFKRSDFDKGYSDLHRFLVEKRNQPFIGIRMANCSLIAAQYGIEYRWPLLDKRLIELYLSLPQPLNLKAGLERFVYRAAVKPYIHRQLYGNKGKKMGRPVIADKDFYIREPAVQFYQLHKILQNIINRDKYIKQVQLFEDGGADEQSNYLYARNIVKIKQLDVFFKKWF